MRSCWNRCAVILGLLLGSAFAAACGPGTPNAGAQAPGSLGYDPSALAPVIELDYLGSRLPEEWQANHVPEVQLFGDGRLVVAGETLGANGKREVHTSVLSGPEIEAVLAGLRDLGFFYMDRAYIQPGAGADLAEQWIHVRLEQGTWSVLVYPADWPGRPDAFAEAWAYVLGIAGRDPGSVVGIQPTASPTPVRYSHSPNTILLEVGEDADLTAGDLVGLQITYVRVFGDGRVEATAGSPDRPSEALVPVGRLSNADPEALLAFVVGSGFLDLERSYIVDEDNYFGPERWIIVRLAGYTQFVTVERDGPMPAAFQRVWERLLNLETLPPPLSPLATPTP